MENKMKKTLSFLLMLLLLSGSFSACSGDQPSVTTPAASDSTEATTPDVTEELPTLSEKTYDGRGFTLLTAFGMAYSDFDQEQNTAGYDLVNEQIFRRNSLIEEKYDIKLETVYEKGTSFGNGPGYRRLSEDYIVSDCSYDICEIGIYDAAQLALSGYLYDLNALPYVDLQRSWWDQKANEDLMINNIMFYTTGDISFIDNIATHMVMFNKDMLKEYNLEESPITLAEQNLWTLDKLTEMVAKVSVDVDGNDLYDRNDIYGLLTWNDTIISALASARERVATIGTDGRISLTLYNDRTVSLFDKYMEMNNTHNVFNYQTKTTDWDVCRKEMFDNNRALFYFTLFTTVPKHLDSSVRFGIVPYPKLDEQQADYGHYVSATHACVVAVEQFVTDPECTGTILEDMAYIGKSKITPAYYEQTLKARLMPDEESYGMLDIIFASRVFDVGIYYKIGGAQTYAANLNGIMTTGNNNFASRYQFNEKAAQTMIDNINKQFEEAKVTGNS